MRSETSPNSFSYINSMNRFIEILRREIERNTRMIIVDEYNGETMSDTERQRHLMPLRAISVGIIGCGGTGSHLAITLAKIGVKRLMLVDGDTVGEENIASQMFGKTHIGKGKVTALKGLIEAFTLNNTRVETYEEMLDYDTHPDRASNIMDALQDECAIIAVCVDSQEAREKIICEYNADYSLYTKLIDIRVGRDQYELYFLHDCLEEKGYAKYKETLTLPTASDPCNAKISFTTNALAAQRAVGAIIGQMIGNRNYFKGVVRETGHIYDTAIVEEVLLDVLDSE